MCVFHIGCGGMTCIIQMITDLAEVEYPKWRIGITSIPEKKMAEHGNPDSWHVWKLDRSDESWMIEQHFLSYGMTGKSHGPSKISYVYVFKK